MATDTTHTQDAAVNPLSLLPNQLTVARMVMVPLFVLLLSFDHLVCFILGWAVFIVACLTDYYDGKIARERNLISNFGKLLDPVADKIVVAAAFIMAMLLDDLWIPGWTVVAILGREFLVTGVRALAAGEGLVIAANSVGKTKTLLQMIFIHTCFGLVLAKRLLELMWPATEGLADYALYSISFGTAVTVALYTIYSGVQFLYLNWSALHLDRV